MPEKKQNDKYTYRDYLTWPEGERWELVDGVPYMQSAPSWQHQIISRGLMTQFDTFLRDKKCEVIAAPFDLRLPEGNEADEDTVNVFQPDIVMICDRDGLKGTGYFGVPALIIEISSPSTSKVDKIWKFNKYEKAGVKEYWIVEPEGVVSVFTLQDNMRYGRPEIYSDEQQVTVGIFPELTIDLKAVFGAV